MTDRKLAADIVQALRQVLPERKDPIALHEPAFSGREWEYVKECLDSGWVSSAGRFVERFERELAELTGIPHVVAVVNGTAALHVCLLLAGVRPGDEVLVPSLTFVATANAVRYCGAIPHFVDVSPVTLGMDADTLSAYLNEIVQTGLDGTVINRATGRRIAAVVPMHTFGHPVDLEPLLALCERYRLPMVEDAAESLGSLYRGRHTGSFGLLGAFSFNGNKIVTTGGGGAIVTSDAELAKAARHLTTTAKRPHPWAFWHDQVGFNYRMPNLNAALGCAQLEQLDRLLDNKRKLYERYRRFFADVQGVRVLQEPPYARSNYWLNAILLEKPDLRQRDEVLQATHDAGFLTRPVWTPLHKLPMYTDCPRMPLPVTEQLEQAVINVPSSPWLVEE